MDDAVIHDELGIRRTLAAYCHHCDDGDFTSLAELFTPEGAFVYRGEAASGRAALARRFEAAQRERSARGKHLTLNTIVEVDGDRAQARSDFLFLRFVDGALTPAVVGRYEDDLLRVEGQWLIERRECEPLGPPVS
jgi:ketosteroid isomerase-like protein